MPTAVDMQALFNADGVVKLRRRGAPTALWSCGDAEEHARRGALARRLDAGLQEPRGACSLGGTSMAAAWRGGDLDKLWRPSQRRRGWPGRLAQLLFLFF